jgi:hypothetical protein
MTGLYPFSYYVLFFLHLETQQVTVAGITRHPREEWMIQMARKAVDAIDGPDASNPLCST